MMMVSDDCLVECKIDDSSDEADGGGEQMNTPPPPPEFRSKAPTPAPRPKTPPPRTPTPTPTPTPPPTPTQQPVNRDPYGINKHLKVEVSDVLAEPATPRSLDTVWLYSVLGFEKARVWTYRCLSLLLAVPFAFLCGLFLAVLACLHVWFVVPCIQLSNTFLPCLRSLCLCAVNVVIAPFCASLALCCSQIAISLSNKDWQPMRDKECGCTMFSFITSILPTSYFLPEWLTLDTNPVDCLLQGLVGACGISVLCSLTRVHLFLEERQSDEDDGDKPGQRRPSQQRRTKTGLTGTLQFALVTAMLSVVGSRVASLVVLEFCLRAVSGWVTAGPESSRILLQLLVQSQFSLGCALTCSLYFLHEGASQRWLCLLLAAVLSWFLARQATRLLHHVMALFELHSSQRYCGICISLLTSGRLLLPLLCRLMIIIFSVAVVASISIINKHFLSATEALRFWTPLTICYTLLVVYMQEDQHRLPGSQATMNTVVVRLGGLMVLMLTVGRWADVIHILMCFLGEASCLIPTLDLLDAASSQSVIACIQEEEDYINYTRRERRRRPQTQEKEHHR